MKFGWIFWVLTAWLTATGLGAGDGVAYINVSEERRFPVAWSRPEFVINNGVVSFTPPTPIEWETRMVGFEFTIEYVAVQPFVLANNLAPITPEIRIRNTAGKEQAVATKRQRQRLNGQLFEPLGTLAGRVYFKHIASGKLCSLPVATDTPETTPDAATTVPAAPAPHRRKTSTRTSRHPRS